MLISRIECYNLKKSSEGFQVTVYKDTDRRFDIQAEDGIDVAVLEVISFDYPDSDTEVVYETDEFTAVCPWSGLPDFARLVIRYVPHRSLIELKSLKYYLTSYRNVGILQEHTVNRILQDLAQRLEPVSMVIEAHYRERGGLTTRVVARYENK